MNLQAGLPARWLPSVPLPFAPGPALSLHHASEWVINPWGDGQPVTAWLRTRWGLAQKHNQAHFRGMWTRIRCSISHHCLRLPGGRVRALASRVTKDQSLLVGQPGERGSGSHSQQGAENMTSGRQGAHSSSLKERWAASHSCKWKVPNQIYRTESRGRVGAGGRKERKRRHWYGWSALSSRLSSAAHLSGRLVNSYPANGLHSSSQPRRRAEEEPGSCSQALRLWRNTHTFWLYAVVHLDVQRFVSCVTMGFSHERKKRVSIIPVKRAG